MELNCKIKSLFLVLGGFICLNIAHFVFGHLLEPLLYSIFPSIPKISNAIISSSSISPVIAIIYFIITTKRYPILIFDKNLFPHILAGLFLAWLVFFLNMIVSQREIPFAQNIISSPKPFLYINIFLVVIWGPLLEEILCRGYFYEMLRKSWSDKYAFLLSSLLFVIPHGIWGSFDINLIFIFLYSGIFTIVYTNGGIVASVIVHSSVNAFLLLINL